MLAFRDQENLVHAHQTTAAGKPLNQPVRGLQPKTPSHRAPKTPFKVALNDENRPLGFNGQKKALKGLGGGNEQGLQTSKNDGNLDKNAFITPLCPRARAPLGVKTTNAKAQAFQTVKPEKTNKRPSTARKSVKSKITVAPSEPVQSDVLAVDGDDVPEVEYCPPAPVPLPDPPEEFDYDQTFPQFKGANLCRGWEEIYLDEPKDEHGVPLRVKDFEEKSARYDREVERQIEESLRNMPDLGADLDKQVDAMIAAGPRDKRSGESKVDTVRARGAANALSHSKEPSAATKPTSSSLQKTKKKPAFAVLNSQKMPTSTNPSFMRNAAVGAVSKNTIGFPRARHAPSILPPKHKQSAGKTNPHASETPNQSDIHPARFRELYGEPPEGSEMWLRLREHELLMGDVDDNLANDLFEGGLDELAEEDDEVFQLPMPS